MPERRRSCGNSHLANNAYLHSNCSRFFAYFLTSTGMKAMCQLGVGVVLYHFNPFLLCQINFPMVGIIRNSAPKLFAIIKNNMGYDVRTSCVFGYSPATSTIKHKINHHSKIKSDTHALHKGKSN